MLKNKAGQNYPPPQKKKLSLRFTQFDLILKATIF